MKENKILELERVDWHSVARLLALGFFILAFCLYLIAKG